MKLNAKRGAVVLFIGVTLIVLRCTSFCGDLQILTQLKLPEDGEHNTPPWTHFNHNFIHHYFIGNQSTYPPKIVPSRNHNSGVASTPGLAALTSERFIITQEFKFPHPKTMELINVIEQSNWIQELRSILLKWQGKRQIVMVTSNSAYKEVLLNWLISAVLVAAVPLKHILVVAHDEAVWHLLHGRGLTSVFVPPSSLFKKSAEVSLFGQIMFTRISVMRLLNHWGFDVAMFDTDALLLKNPWLLFEQFTDSGIVASMGKFPSELSVEWGTALCVGVILIRNSNQTGIAHDRTASKLTAQSYDMLYI